MPIIRMLAGQIKFHHTLFNQCSPPCGSVTKFFCGMPTVIKGLWRWLPRQDSTSHLFISRIAIMLIAIPAVCNRLDKVDFCLLPPSGKGRLEPFATGSNWPISACRHRRLWVRLLPVITRKHAGQIRSKGLVRSNANNWAGLSHYPPSPS
jgi:hypothetical protein